MSAGKAAKRLGVSTRTLRRYTLEGVLEDRRSPGGRRIFRIGDLDALSRRRGHPALPLVGGVVLYGRVSSHRQRAEGDLDGRWFGCVRRPGADRGRRVHRRCLGAAGHAQGPAACAAGLPG
ncbi:MerR family DNA-binding transcriptional regulator [Streptomyces sp. NPDC055722]